MAGGSISVFVLGDSRPLFDRRDGAPLWPALRASLGRAPARAGYVGAANGDRLEYWQMFDRAAELAGVVERRRVRAAAALADVDLVLLAGGDAVAGWRALCRTGIAAAVVDRYRSGAVLVGVSAGAVQLGQLVGTEAGLGLAPFIVDAHREAGDWGELRAALRAHPDKRGLGVGYGAAARCSAAGEVEVLCGPVRQLPD